MKEKKKNNQSKTKQQIAKEYQSGINYYEEVEDQVKEEKKTKTNREY